MLLFTVDLVKYVKLNKPFTNWLPFLPSKKNLESKIRENKKKIITVVLIHLKAF